MEVYFHEGYYGQAKVVGLLEAIFPILGVVCFISIKLSSFLPFCKFIPQMSLALFRAVNRKIDTLQFTRVRKLFHDNKIDFEQFKSSVSNVMSIFIDAERCQFSLLEKVFVEQLLDVVYDLDLLLDEALVYSNSRRPSLSKSITRQFIDIMTRFDAIAKEKRMLPQQDVLFKHEKTVRSREETCSYVIKKDIIGREEVKETVIGMLLSHSYYSNSNPCLVTILGTGGVGKTALAQLIFNDEKIESHFVLRFWLCLAENTSLKTVLFKMYCRLEERVWGWKDKDEVTLEMLVKQIRETIQKKRYLLVLDDVSCNAKIWWDHLGDIFSDGDKGSRILVTTRSIMVAKVISNNCIYELIGLSDKDSLELFKTLAFSSDQDIDVELLHIAEVLTQKCANLPLTIKVIASLVYGQEKGMWVSLLDHDFPELPEVKEKLRHIDESDDKRRSIQTIEETFSYVKEERIIGREADKEAVVGMLLSDDATEDHVSFISIVGMAGMGKTALAQLIFNDEKIESHFVLRFWVCLAENTSLKTVLCKMYCCLEERVWDWEDKDEVTLEMLVKQIRETIQRKRYLLVLDDVSCNAKIWWDHLGDIFSDGDKGSRILVTTRSIMVAKVISNNCIYELIGLSDKDSLELFKTLAFSSDQDIDVELLHIAEVLTQKCANLPLTIKVIASLVYGQKKGMWVSLLGHDFPELPEVKEKLRHIDESDDKRRSIQTIEETFSYVKEERIIGREADKEAVVGMLLSDDATEDHVSFISIVGMAGMGKTALAQLVFNDDRIKCGFELRFWVCVADHSQNLTKSGVLLKILQHLVAKISPILELLRTKVVEMIKGKRFLLVLDDVWCEDDFVWHNVMDILSICGKGSKILITSRSKIVSTATASRYTHELDGLSEDHSWELFKKSAFQPGELYLQESDDELFHIGREVLKKCSGVPLFIRVIGSVLRNEEVWLKLKTTELVELSQFQEHVMPALRLSYDLLEFKLKQCFAFCSIFPKNYVIQKQVLISLWLAQGYLDGDGDDTGEDYCFIFLSRHFFKDIQRNEYGEVMSFVMHHLTHDLAQEVAGSGFLMLPVADSNFPRRVKIRHLSVSENAGSYDDLFNLSIFLSETLQTIFNLRGYALCSPEDVATAISVCRHLKLLDLQNLALRTLPDTFDNVPLLRYLDLSDNEELEILPVSITRLHNLRVLRLRGCKNLKELPDDLGNLTNLEHLDIVGCKRLTCMPVGLDKLTCLHRLTMFVVGGDDSNRVSGRIIKSKADRLANLRGELLIKVVQFSSSNMQNVVERACIVKDAPLHALKIMYADGSSEAGKAHEALLERFHPNQVLQRIVIQGYQGAKLPSWALAVATYVPNLVIIKLSHFRCLQHLTTLSQLCHLKYLHLRKMWNVESIETDSPFALPSTSTNSMVFFPALEKLVLDWMPNLKRWWRDLKWVKMEAGSGCLVDGNDVHMEQLILPSFPCLRDLSIYRCPSLTYFPPCPHVKSLDLRGINEEMTFCTKGGDPTLCLEKLSLYYNARVLESIVGEFVAPATFEINLKYFHEEKSLSKAREAFQRCASSLRNLSIDGFYKLESLTGGGIEHLTNLQSLSIMDCSELDFVEVELEQEEMPWESLQSLSSLTFDRIPKMVNLPKGLEHLTSLQSLHIRRCNNLKDIGDCLCKLTSLQALHIEDCYNLNPLPDYISCRTPQLKLDVKNCPQLESV